MEDHIPDLLESKQPENMAIVVAARLAASGQAYKEIQLCLSELTQEALGNELKRSGELMEINSYVSRIGRGAEGYDLLLAHIRREKAIQERLAEEDLEL